MNITARNSVIVIGKGTDVTVTEISEKYKDTMEALSKIPRSKEQEDFITQLGEITPNNRIKIDANNCEIHFGK